MPRRKALFFKSDLSFYVRLIIRPYFWYFFLIVSLSFLAAAFEMATIGLGVPLLEAATQEKVVAQNSILAFVKDAVEFFGFAATNDSILFTILIVIAVVAVGRSLIVVAQQFWTQFVSQKLRIKVKAQLFESILRAQYGYLAKRSRGALLFDVNNPSVKIHELIRSFGNLLLAVFNSVLLIGLMLYLSWWATVGIGLLAIVWVRGWRIIMDPLSLKRGRWVYDLDQKMGKIDVDAVDGVRVVKSHRLESRMVDLLTDLLKKELRPKLEIIILRNGMHCLNEIVAAIVIVVLGGVTLGFGVMHMPFSELLVLLFAIRRVSPALANINSAFVSINEERKNVEVMGEILEKIPQENRGGKTIQKIENIKVSHVHFNYSGKSDKNVLDDVTLELKRCQVTAVVGSTGAGKSTFANLLMRFYQPQSGNIFVNGTDLNELDLSSWREKIGYVSQDIFLFNETIWQNIVLWNENISREVVEKAVKSAQLHDFILSLPEGYHSIVGDRGLKLSGGQAQRLAIARALLKRPEILIFDEATSALDNLTERVVYEAIDELRMEAIVIVIAHRLSTIKNADQICVLQSGKIVEQGPHHSLMRLDGVYAELYKGSYDSSQTAVLAGGVYG